MSSTNDNLFADLFQRLFYSKTNEKVILAQLLKDIFASRSFNHAIDIGAGPGEITAVIERYSNHLTIVELNKFYKNTLISRFPNAKIIIEDIRVVPLDPIYDLILLNQMLYFLPTEEWSPLCVRLAEALTTKGELFVILNDHDRGDLKRIFGTRYEQSKASLSWYYLPLDQFVSNLRNDGWTVLERPYSYEVIYSSEEETITALEDVFFGFQEEAIKNSHGSSFRELAKSFKRSDGNFVISMDARLISIIPHHL
jgi:hypothetical protein